MRLARLRALERQAAGLAGQLGGYRGNIAKAEQAIGETLVQIIDRPGTDDDKAVFEVASGGREERLTLGRQGGEWVLEQLA